MKLHPSGQLTGLVFIGLLAIAFSFPSVKEAAPPPLTIDERIDTIMAQMELIDKVGEMTQLALDVISVGEPYNVAEPHTLDPGKLREVLVEYRVGSILNVSAHAFTVQEWQEIITAIQEVAVNDKPTGIPVLYGIDAVHGANYTREATLFPQQIGLAATWNPTLAYEAGRVTAYETRASYIPWTFSPVLDIGRDPRWPRIWEGFGEDVLLSSRMGEEMVRGFQGDDLTDPYRVAACLKHYVGYSVPWTGKDRTPAYIPERQMREYHLPGFQRAVDAGAPTVMVCSGEVNGIPVHTSRWLLHDVLRTEMGFEGLVVSDWEDVLLLVDRHQVARDLKEAIKLSVNAGMDMAMVPMTLEFPRLLRELVEEGEVPMSRVDEAVRRILQVKLQLGLFENPYPAGVDYSKFASEEHRLIAQRSAEESITLLKNEDNMLPLTKDAKLLVTGPNADNLRCLNGGWTGTWQGSDPAYDTSGKMTILGGLQAGFGKEQVTYLPGTSFDEEIDITAAVAAAQDVDVIVACVGELSYTEVVGSIDDMNLPAVQTELIEALAATGKPIVLVLAEGRPRIIREMEPHAKAVLMAYLPGNEGAPALANILTGEVNPSGRLPYTYPKYANALFTYDYKGTERVHTDFSRNGIRVQWPFGHGLSYTEFAYSDLSISSGVLSDSEPLSVSVTVTNTGDRAGQEVVQLYVRDEVASITPSNKRLRGFQKIRLEKGQSRVVTFEISPEDLAFVGRQNTWITEAGQFTLMIGDQSAPFVYEPFGK